MNHEQLLLTKLAGECSDVAKAALKVQQFGMEYSYAGKTNQQRLHDALNHMMAVMQVLNTDCHVNFIPDQEKIDAKIENIRQYEEYSRDLGLTYAN